MNQTCFKISHITLSCLLYTSPSVGHIMSSRSSKSSDSEAKRNIVWKEVTKQSAQRHDHTFLYQEMPGLKHYPLDNSFPICYFRLFFTFSVLDIFVKFINKYAKQFIVANFHVFSKHCRYKECKTAIHQEIDVYKRQLWCKANIRIVKGVFHRGSFP